MGMKEIPIRGGFYVLVDDEDYEYLSQFKWNLNQKGYARRSIYLGKKNGKTLIKNITMHKEIMSHTKCDNLDHSDGDKLNNQKYNLRPATYAENARNRKPQKGKVSKYKGVCWRKDCNKWRARIMANGKWLNIGSYFTEEAAAKAYDAACVRLHGEFAYINMRCS